MKIFTLAMIPNLIHTLTCFSFPFSLFYFARGGSRISGKRAHMYKGVCVCGGGGGGGGGLLC